MTDEEHDKLCEFQKEFAQLVRKFVPEWPTTAKGMSFLTALQDSTSCFNPYVWSEEFNKKEDKDV